MGEITDLLHDVRQGRAGAKDQLVDQVYLQLRRIARNQMSDERAEHTLQPTAVVHEAYLKIFEGAEVDWRDRAHFFAVAAGQMRRVLNDHGRAHRAFKRGSGMKVALDETIAAGAVAPRDYDVVDELLERLRKTDAKAWQVIELKFFSGMTDREVAEVTGESHAGIRRHWMFARAWMTKELTAF